MLAAALDPGGVGPIVVNGAPMSYRAGHDAENPMRYVGDALGGAWMAMLASDLGGGTFDGASLVENFEYLNPANTYFTKYYNLYSKIDSEPERFLEFERWWGGFFLMNRAEIKWIVENLFVGDKLAAGEAEWAPGKAFDLKAVRSPIIVFASLGDSITPPQQAINWLADRLSHDAGAEGRRAGDRRPHAPERRPPRHLRLGRGGPARARPDRRPPRLCGGAGARPLRHEDRGGPFFRGAEV